MNELTPDFAGADLRASPNFGERAGGRKPDMLVLHYTGMATAEGALDRLCSPRSEVSSHYLVHEDGRIVQLVAEAHRAWHAGRSLWKGQADLNSASIGIEIVNPGHDGDYPDFPEAQVAAVIELCRNCVERWAIAPERVLAHSDIAPQRKADPGEKFPWRSLFTAGIGHWVAESASGGGRFFQRGDRGQPIEALQSMLRLYGYDADINGLFDDKTNAVVTAFQRHFRPSRVDGVADVSTIETLHRLLSNLPPAAQNG